jgi:glycosyltransferase involved in cell wall biosynthesis
MYPPHHLGGYELAWAAAVGAMRSAGHDVEVLTTDFRRPDVEADAADSDAHVHRQLRWYWRDHDFPRLSLRQRLALERHNHTVLGTRLATRRPDVVAWWSMGGMSLSLVAAVGRAGVPAAAFVHDDWLLYGPRVDQWTRTFRRLPGSAALVERLAGVPARFDPRPVGRWAFVSQFVRDRALGAGWELGETEVVPSGVGPEFAGPSGERAWDWRLLYVGRIDERKGLDVAVRALATLPEATLTVVGEGDDQHRRALDGLARQLGVDGRLHLDAARPRAELPVVYDDHDAVLFPARWDEPWGLVPLEAMARGRPVVATATGGSAEYLRDDQNCLVVPRDDVPALATAARRLAEDPELRTRLRAGGLDTAARHTEERSSAAAVAVLEAVAGARL